MRAVYVIFTLALAAGALAAPPSADAQLELNAAWVRLPPPGARVVGVYGTLSNRGETIHVVTDARAPGFAMGMLHESVLDGDGMSRMRHLDRIELTPGETFPLEPGAAHIMLMRPETPLAEGQRVTLELEIDGAWRAFDLEVLNR